MEKGGVKVNFVPNAIQMDDLAEYLVPIRNQKEEIPTLLYRTSCSKNTTKK